jgi:1,5-anhydro-D-fructose reductase (1,5-anhydro-D-mannitol-forming)
MANDLAGCREMAEACQGAGVQLGIGFQYRQHPAHIDIRASIREGRIGTPLVADASICLPPMVVPQWYDDQGMAAGGVVPMSGIHRLDLLAFVLDQEVRMVAATTRARGDLDGYEEVACAVLEFDRGVTSTVRFAMNAPHGGDGLAIHGTEGSIRATGTTTQWWGGGGGEVVVTSSVGTHTSSYAAVDLYQRQVDGFLAMLRGDDSTVARAADGAAAVSVAHAIRESGRTRRHVSVTPTGIENEEAP